MVQNKEFDNCYNKVQKCLIKIIIKTIVINIIAIIAYYLIPMIQDILIVFIVFLNIVNITKGIKDSFQSYYNLNKIKKYLIKNNLLEQIKKIEFWNNKDTLFTNQWIITVQKRTIIYFKYNSIQKIKAHERHYNYFGYTYDKDKYGIKNFIEITISTKNIYNILIDNYIKGEQPSNWKSYISKIENLICQKNKKVIKEKTQIHSIEEEILHFW